MGRTSEKLMDLRRRERKAASSALGGAAAARGGLRDMAMIAWHSISKERATAIWDSDAWMDWTAKERVMLQLFTNRLCMPISEFFAALEHELNHSVTPPVLCACIEGVREEWMKKYGLSLYEVHACCVAMCQDASG